MMKTINKECDKAHDLMMKYMDGELNEKEAAVLREHAAGCETCKADFEIYDFISGELNTGGTGDRGRSPLHDAPPDFTENVMRVIVTLPTPKKVTKSGFERAAYIIAGVASMLFGLGFLLVLNRESIINYLSGIPALDGFMSAIVPITETVGEDMSGAVGGVYGMFLSVLHFMTEYRYLLVGLIAVLAAVQVIMYYRKASASKIKSK